MFNEYDRQCIECGNIFSMDDSDVRSMGDVVWCPICGRAMNVDPDGFFMDGYQIETLEPTEESWVMNYLSDDLNGKWDESDYEKKMASDEKEMARCLSKRTGLSPKHSKFKRKKIQTGEGDEDIAGVYGVRTEGRNDFAVGAGKQPAMCSDRPIKTRRVR